jgi:hypothetical protein
MQSTSYNSDPETLLAQGIAALVVQTKCVAYYDHVRSLPFPSGF